VSATTDPPPSVPEGVQVYSNLPRRVVVSWEPSDDPAVAGYAVYRSPTAGGPFETQVSIDDRLNTVYEEEVDGDLRVMYYRVAAYNRFGGESAPSDPLRAVTKPAPLPPIDLLATSQSFGRVDLQWTHNVETDLEAYEVWRTERSADSQRWSKETRIVSIDAATTTFSDTGVGCGSEAPIATASSATFRARSSCGATTWSSDWSPARAAPGSSSGTPSAPRAGAHSASRASGHSCQTPCSPP
jgi:hypothetical protein